MTKSQVTWELAPRDLIGRSRRDAQRRPFPRRRAIRAVRRRTAGLLPYTLTIRLWRYECLHKPALHRSCPPTRPGRLPTRLKRVSSTWKRRLSPRRRTAMTTVARTPEQVSSQFHPRPLACWPGSPSAWSISPAASARSRPCRPAHRPRHLGRTERRRPRRAVLQHCPAARVGRGRVRRYRGRPDRLPHRREAHACSATTPARLRALPRPAFSSPSSGRSTGPLRRSLRRQHSSSAGPHDLSDSTPDRASGPGFSRSRGGRAPRLCRVFAMVGKLGVTTRVRRCGAGLMGEVLTTLSGRRR
jgi:hypothetical protein